MFPQWMTKAACRGVNTQVFFPIASGPHVYDQAQQICADCPVIDECLAWAFETDSYHGMFGGLTGDDRREIHRNSARAMTRRHKRTINHGTTAGFYAEVKQGLPACNRCRKAYNEAAREKRARLKAERIAASA